MSPPRGSPLLGNDRAHFATDAARKIRPAIAKERRAARSRLVCISSGGDMTKETDERSRNRRNAVESGRIWKARNFIDEHAGEELSLAKVAKVADTSANYLSEKFKEAVGINFVKYVARARYEKAATLLCDTDLRVSEIAFAAGFQSLSQFNRVFKKLAGKSPTAYRAATCAKTACQHMRTLHADAQYRSSVVRVGDYDQGHTLRV
jgi:AraC-like DNA-binding protein